jgi:RNA polymerase sigma-70 factor, ECF subfamily
LSEVDSQAGRLGMQGSRGAGTGMTWPPAQPFALVLERARLLDHAAVSLLYRRFLPVIYRFALARVADVHIAEDITSDVFMVMVEQIDATRAQDELGFAAWLLGITRNKVAQHFRRQRARQETHGEFTDDAEPRSPLPGGDPLEIITARESWSEVIMALQLLTEDQRTVVLYRCVLGFSAEAVGELIGKQAGTVRGLQYRALASLARHIGMSERAAAPARQGRGRHHASR